MKNRHLIRSLMFALLIAWTPLAPAGWTHGGDATPTVIRVLMSGIEHLLGMRLADAPQPVLRGGAAETSRRTR